MVAFIALLCFDHPLLTKAFFLMTDQKESPMIGPSRPYLIRALNEWILDHGGIPYLVIDTTINGVIVPEQYVSNDGQIILNINPSAVQSLILGDQVIEFKARFGGILIHVCIPVLAVTAIYDRQTRQGMVFGMEPGVPNLDGSKPHGSTHVTGVTNMKSKKKAF